MRRSLLHAGAWTVVTGAAVTLSWWGVHTMLAETAHDHPRTLPVPVNSPTAGLSGSADPRSSSTHRPRPPSASGTPKAGAGSPKTAAGTGERGGKSATEGAHGSDAPRSARPSPPARRPYSGTAQGQSQGGQVKGYRTEGGRVVFDLGEKSARLVSATPESGWNMRVWKDTEWIRVTFTGDGRSSSVFCTWNGHPPKVQQYEQ